MMYQSSPPVEPQAPKVRVRTTESANWLLFSRPFRIGRSDDCEVCVKNEYVSRIHAEVVLENGGFWIRDLDSSNGLYLDGGRVKQAPITQRLKIRLGVQGPELLFEPHEQPPRLCPRPVRAEVAQPAPPGLAEKARTGPEESVSPSATILGRYVQHYFGKSAPSAPAGEHTMYVRRAFVAVQTQQKRRYAQIIAVIALLALGAGAYALYERYQLQKQRDFAEELFYSMKSLELDIANLERAVAQSGNPQAMQMVGEYSSQRREMQKNYDRYLAALHVYDRNLTEKQRTVLRVARIFGECELSMPGDFEAQVNKYIRYWQQSDRLANAIRTAQQNGYTRTIPRELLAQGLPPQFFYLALQESNFDAFASGPVTRKGIAKGMWQFVPETAVKYGLRVGPLVDLRRPDPGDERDQSEKATRAAARYLKDLYSTDAQASGFLVMACYNWGEDQVLPLVRSMPPHPRERNFWRLLAQYRERIPQETYDYVFYIVSAAVVGENPHLFGFDFENPLADLESRESKVHEIGRLHDRGARGAD
jgi:membrane-bound lytic murein transglycosylase D